MKSFRQGLRTIDGRAALALLYTACMLTAIEYWFLPSVVEGRLIAERGREPMRVFAPNPGPSLEAGLTWAAASIVGFLVVPLLLTLLVHRERPARIGYDLKGMLRHVWVYLGLYVLMLPVIHLVAQRPDFQGTYPFVKTATQSLGTFLRWEAGYLAQFIALEAFFRGYLLFTLERRMGWNAVFVMTVPYCAIHWHKPPLEAYGAFVAGVVLGFLALRFRSWYWGALLHILVALTMDGLAAHRAGLF